MRNRLGTSIVADYLESKQKNSCDFDTHDSHILICVLCPSSSTRHPGVSPTIAPPETLAFEQIWIFKNALWRRCATRPVLWKRILSDEGQVGGVLQTLRHF